MGVVKGTVCENMACLGFDFPEPESLNNLPLFCAFHSLFFFLTSWHFLVLPRLCFISDLFPFQSNKIHFIILFLHFSFSAPSHASRIYSDSQEFRLERSTDSLFIIMSCLPPSGGGVVFLFSLIGRCMHSWDYGEKNAKCDNLPKISLHSWEESRLSQREPHENMTNLVDCWCPHGSLWFVRNICWSLHCATCGLGAGCFRGFLRIWGSAGCHTQSLPWGLLTEWPPAESREPHGQGRS